MNDCSCYKELISKSEFPIVFRGLLDWELLDWSLEKWSTIFQDKSFPFRCSDQICQKSPMWEKGCYVEYHTMKDFIRFCNDEELLKNKWMYFDYKHIAKCFESNIDMFKSISWANVGFPERNAEDSTIWIGSLGAHTPCHVDSYGCNIVAQIYGSKRWLLFPPSETDNLKPTRIPYEESSVFSNINFSCFESFKDTFFEHCYLVDLNPGDVLFVPSKWWHYVENMSTAISINTWLPHDNDDEWRLEESLVRFLISSVAENLSSELKEIILNPNEIDIEDSSITLNILNSCKNKIGRNNFKSSASLQSNNTGLYQNQDHIHKYDFVPKISIATMKYEMKKLSVCCVLNMTPHNIKLENKLNNLICVLNAFCHPDIIKQVKNKLLQ